MSTTSTFNAFPRREFPQLILLLLLLLLVYFASTPLSVSGKMTHVRITNELRPDLNLTAHCKSKDDDLGEQEIPYEEYFEFQFKPNFWGTTLFFCDMEWKYSAPHYINIYKQKRDKKRCSICLWKIKVDGACMFNYKTKAYDICYEWQKNALLISEIHLS
ncbi:Self-incompatibility protein [Trema orientale]|uniref:S-protein homolog n=1 Tax=Trema orientale TaxID=63057 RepID=A0A2P5CYF3_TREOI|nr:Self-incompatibility protein [Trema orientale]